MTRAGRRAAMAAVRVLAAVRGRARASITSITSLVAIAMVCAGCARASTSAAPTAASLDGSSRGVQDARAEITALDREITEALARAELSPPALAACSGAACGELMRQPFSTAVVGDPACRPAPAEACTDTCKLAGSICDNQRKICALAASLDGDDWAANKCSSARASCTAAQDRCCHCAR